MRQLETHPRRGRVPRRPARVPASSTRSRNATWPDLIALLDRAHARGSRRLEPRVGRRAGRPDDRDRALDGDGRTIARLAFAQRDPARRGLRVAAARCRWRSATRRDRGRCRSSAAGAPVDVTAAAGEHAGARSSSCRPAAASATAVSCSTARALDYLLAHLPDIADPLTRGAALGHALGRDARWPASRRTRSSRRSRGRACRARRDEQLTSSACSATRERPYWQFLTPTSARRDVAGAREAARAGSTRAPTPSQKSAWFNALRDVALTPARQSAGSSGSGRQTETVPGLTLAEPDYITLALELAVREVPDWREHPRRAARRASRIPTARRGSSSSGRRSPPMPRRATRSSQRSRDVKNRRREPWVLEGSATCTTRCARQRRRSTSRPSLELLREIQRPATSSSRSAGWTRRSADISPRAPRSMVSDFLDRVAEGISGAPAPRHPVVGRRPDRARRIRER